MKKISTMKSAILCLDGAIKKLKKGEDITSHLFQFCRQLQRHCKDNGLKEESEYFKERAEILRVLSQN